MATCDEFKGFDDANPTVSPLISRYLVLSWAMLIEWEIDFKLKNFEVIEFKLDSKKFVKCNRFMATQMQLSKFDNFIVKHLLENGCRVWYKAIGDLVNINDSTAGCLCRGQKGFLCVQISNKMIEHKVVAYLGHQRYCVRIKNTFPW